MNKTIEQLIQSFEPRSKNRKQIFNDFLYHCFTNIDKIISSKNRKRNKNKYIIMRDNMIKYLIAHEQEVIDQLSR